jgi:hypothetical protein
VRFRPFAFPLRTALATPGVPSAGNARQREEPWSIHRARTLWTTLWTRMWTMHQHRGEAWDSTVDEQGRGKAGGSSYLLLTSNNVVPRSSTACGQKESGVSCGVSA